MRQLVEIRHTNRVIILFRSGQFSYRTKARLEVIHNFEIEKVFGKCNLRIHRATVLKLDRNSKRDQRPLTFHSAKIDPRH